VPSLKAIPAPCIAFALVNCMTMQHKELKSVARCYAPALPMERADSVLRTRSAPAGFYANTPKVPGGRGRGT
jgi:hypothetical protein